MIREARKEDEEDIVELMKIMFIDMELPIMRKVPWKDLKPVLVEAVKQNKYRFNYNNAMVKEIDGQIAGFFYGYKGGSASDSYEPIETLFEKYNLPVFETDDEEESFDGEWYLDTLVTNEVYRGQGVGSELIEAAFLKAKENNMSVIGLNVDRENPRAKALYERMGFLKVDEIILSQHNYDHMQKNL